jgi:hypothetical protein
MLQQLLLLLGQVVVAAAGRCRQDLRRNALLRRYSR